LPTISILPRLYNPVFPQRFIKLLETLKLNVLLITRMNMKCHRKGKPRISTFFSVKLLKIDKESLLVAQMMVLRQFIVYSLILSSNRLR